MSHVDEGTLHAYLDGALTPSEVRAMEAHVAACPVCGDRLAEERALRSRAGELLGLVAPPERALPAFSAGARAVRASRWWRARVPFAWAATVVVSLGLGVYIGSSGSLDRSAPEVVPAAPLPDAAASRTPTRERELLRESGRGALAPPPALPARGPAVSKTAAPERSEARPAGRAAAVTGAPSKVVVGAAPPLTVQSAEMKPVAEAAPEQARAEGAVALERRQDGLAATTFSPGLTLDSARAVLGRDPVALPGVPIRALRRVERVGYTAVVVIEQQLDSATVIQLVEGRRAEVLADVVVTSQAHDARDSGAIPKRRQARLVTPPAPPPRQAVRFVDELEVTISGPLAADSLTRLLGRVAPVGR